MISYNWIIVSELGELCSHSKRGLGNLLMGLTDNVPGLGVGKKKGLYLRSLRVVCSVCRE